METINMEGPVSIKEILAQLDGKFPMDEAVVEALPQGTTFQSVENFGTSAWTITGRVMAIELDGTETPYFLKIAYGEHGGTMLRGEFESSKIIRELMPRIHPEARQIWQSSKYRTQPLTFIFQNSSKWMSKPLLIRRSSLAGSQRCTRASQSPTGQFGFHVATCDGKLAHTVEWEESWAVFYRKLLRWRLQT
ncbi:hypothetical protein XPA_002648 [Xanthoria parietina]